MPLSLTVRFSVLFGCPFLPSPNNSNPPFCINYLSIPLNIHIPCSPPLIRIPFCWPERASKPLSTEARRIQDMAHGRAHKNRSLESYLVTDKPVVNVPVPVVKVFRGQGLEFENLSYSVMKKTKKDGVWITKEAYLLNNISGQALRGEVTAILGPSGAGKSTFLDALAGRIAQGSLEGSVRMDGRPVCIFCTAILYLGS